MAEVASAFVSLLPSAKGFGSKLDKEVGSQVDTSGKKAGAAWGKLFAAGAGLALGAKAFSFLGDSLGEARDAQVVGARTENVIRKMGNAAGISAVGVGKLAASISNKTGIDDEAIQSGQNLLLTFGNVKNAAGEGNDIFNQTSKLMVDMSAAMGTDAKGSAIQLGKALNDPVKGLTALSRVGVSFTAQQQKQIKGMVESGKTLGAQKIILGELEKQFGGAAAAMTTPAEKAKVAWGNLQEDLGTRLLPIVDRVLTAFVNKGIPAISSFAGAAASFLRPVLRDIGAIISTVIVPAVASFISGMQSGTGAGGRFAAILTSASAALSKVATFITANKTVVGTFVGIIGTVVIALKVWRTAQLALNIVMSANPIGLVVVAIAALAAGLVFAYKKSTTFRNIVDSAFVAVKTIAASVASFFTAKVPAAFNTVRSAAASALGWVKSNWPTILAILAGPFGVAALLIVKNWDKIKAGGQAALDFIKSIPGKVTAVFSGAATLLYNAGTQLMQGLANGIQNKIEDAINAVQAGLSKIKGLLPGSPIKWGPLKNWNNGGAGERLMDLVARGITAGTPAAVKAAQEAFGKIGDSLQSTRDDLKSTLDGLKSDFASLADSVANAFTGDLFGVTATEAVAATKDAAAVAGRSVGQNFVDNLMAKKGQLTGLLSSFKTLTGWGLDPAFLSQLFASGNGALITDLAGMGQFGALNAGGLFADVTSLGTQLGETVAKNDPVADRIDVTNQKLDKVVDQLEFLGSDIGKELNSVARRAARRAKHDGKGGK